MISDPLLIIEGVEGGTRAGEGEGEGRGKERRRGEERGKERKGVSERKGTGVANWEGKRDRKRGARGELEAV